MPSWVSRDSIAVGLEVQSTPFRSATGQQTAKDANRTAYEKETDSEQEQRLAYDGRADSAHLGDNGSSNGSKIGKQGRHSSSF